LFTVAMTHVVPLHVASDEQSVATLQSNWHEALQPTCIPFWLPRSHCSPVSIVPLPQSAPTQTPFWQVLFVPQLVPFASGVPAAHFWPVWPLTITELHDSTPLHGFMSSHEFGFVVHENLQVGSQPEPTVFMPAPKSQSSPGSTIPLPHIPDPHTPFEQTMLVPHVVPFALFDPAVHVCIVSLHVPLFTHAFVDAQLRMVSVLTHENLHVLSQPSPFVELPSSHSSGASTIPSPHDPATQLPITQTLPCPHEAPFISGVPGAHL
jgi:hypothetical protein